MRKIVSIVLAASMIASMAGTTDSYASSKNVAKMGYYSVNDETPVDPDDENVIGDGQTDETKNENQEDDQEQDQNLTDDQADDQTDDQTDGQTDDQTDDQSLNPSSENNDQDIQDTSAVTLKRAPSSTVESVQDTSSVTSNSESTPVKLVYDPIGTDDIKIIDTTYVK
jgi:hypothetical protein